jgi:hypothetical protein
MHFCIVTVREELSTAILQWCFEYVVPCAVLILSELERLHDYVVHSVCTIQLGVHTQRLSIVSTY